jgi:hypothetical protein
MDDIEHSNKLKEAKHRVIVLCMGGKLSIRAIAESV